MQSWVIWRLLVSRYISQGTVNKLGNEKKQNRGKMVKNFWNFTWIVQESMWADVHYLLKKTPPSHFTLTQVQLLVLVSAAGILAVPNWWVTALSLQSQPGCSCCWHRLTALSQGWKCGTTATRPSHPYIIFAHCQRHVCTFLALELLGHKTEIPSAPAAQTSPLPGATV